MRVLHVLNELRPSGAEVMLKLSRQQWRFHGVDPEILATGNIPGEYADVLRDAGYIIHHLRFSKHPEFFLRFRRFLRLHGFDVVHLHAERAFPYFALTAYAAGVHRVVRTIHNAFPFAGGLRRRRSAQRKRD
jgi:glycosyltransferase involved in cell wall biosynthesis